MSEVIKNSPMMEQWFDCKKEGKDALLLFRLGDFYEAFHEDAHLISKELSITLTKRQGVPMCGIPFHASDAYIDRLITKGYKVAIAEQMGDPKESKGLVHREIVKIVSPGTLIDSALLLDKTNNFFASICQIGKTFGLAFLDLTTGECRVTDLEEKKHLLDELFRLKPKELLISKKLQKDHASLFSELAEEFSFLINVQEDSYFDYQFSHDLLLSHFQIFSLDSFGLKDKPACVQACGGLIFYLQDERHLTLSHIQKIETENLSSYLSIDHTCIKNLEILESLSGHKHTLLELLDKTKTPMGGRLIRNWLRHPLLSVEEIQKRQKAIAELMSHSSSTLKTHLEQVRDLERITMKIVSGYATPKDLGSLRSSLETLPSIQKETSSFSSPLLHEIFLGLKDLSLAQELLQKSLVDQPPFRLSDERIFKSGYNQELDELSHISENSKTWMANYQNQLRESAQIKTLKVGFTRAFGYYIEVSKGQAGKIPDFFQRRQTLVNAERFVTEELKNFEHTILTAEEKIRALENHLFQNLKETLATYANDLHSSAKAIASIDTLLSLATVATQHSYSCPVVDSTDLLYIEKGRHPIIESFGNMGQFIPNDTDLNSSDKRLFLITGPNMAGKSTYIRQVALITIMAQIGSFVPAASAHIGIVDKIFSRIGASDDLSRGQSTFMVEMTETAHILHNATERSLVILDEIGRGTSTYDGIAIAWAVAEFLLTKKTKTLFATHYWELTELEKKFPGALNYNVAVQENPEGIVFLRKIVKGGTDKSYGIHVARLAGLPQMVLQKATEILHSLEKRKSRPKKETCIEEELPLFYYQKSQQISEPWEEIKKEIQSLDVEKTTPIMALQKLFELQQKISNAL
ncbi:MAG: DNA mismatch repair protein MutS [Chlamydiota bacterium]